MRVESFEHGLRPLSIVYSLPRALALQAAVLLQCGMLMENSEASYIYILSTTFIGTICFLYGVVDVL